MIIILALLLILASLISLISVKRKQERLEIFSQIAKQKISLSAIIEEQIKFNQSKTTFWKNITNYCINFVINHYYLLIDSFSNKMRLFATIILSIIGCLVFNHFYLNLNLYLVLPVSLCLTIVVIIFNKKRHIKKVFYDTFPEALNIITGVVTSGSSISAGFNECTLRIDGPLSVVMKQISNRIDIGENVENVLLASYRKLPFPEYYFFILTIIVNMDSGGELKEVLSRLSKMIINNRILAKNRDSKTSELKMTVTILSIIPFAFIVLIKFISPENYDYLINTHVGNILIYYVISSVIIGVLFIKKMINKVI